MEKFCQSCGMPLKDHQGSNADGSLSLEYCIYCWKDGSFTQPEIKTAKEMQKRVYDELKNNHKMNSFVAWLFTLMIPSLKRWK